MKNRSTESDRAWQRMLSGRRLDLLDPSPLDIEIADIAHGLARVARWNGQTSGAHIFSVAQHTLLVECVMREQTPRLDARFRLAALLHPIGAVILLLFTAVATYWVHNPLGRTGEDFRRETTISLEHLAIIGGLLLIAVTGPGTLALRP